MNDNKIYESVSREIQFKQVIDIAQIYPRCSSSSSLLILSIKYIINITYQFHFCYNYNQDVFEKLTHASTPRPGWG